MGHPSIHRPYIPIKKSNKITGSVFGGMRGMLISKCKKSLWGILEDEILAPARHFRMACHFMKHSMFVFYLFLDKK
jgi:hypothetical protein